MTTIREIDKFLEGCDYASLKLVRTKVDARIEAQAAEEKEKAKADLEARAKELGFDVADLWDLSGGRKRRSSAGSANGQRTSPKPKYRGPDGQEWSGRGRMATWLRDLTDGDEKKMQKYLIDKT
jgi:DNA-binding protein H-NS